MYMNFEEHIFPQTIIHGFWITYCCFLLIRNLSEESHVSTQKEKKQSFFFFFFPFFLLENSIKRMDSFIKENMWKASIKHIDPHQVSATAGCSLSVDGSTAYISPEDKKI